MIKHTELKSVSPSSAASGGLAQMFGLDIRAAVLARIFHAPEILWPVVFVQRRRM
jgi:hypothetical protein